LRGKKSGKVEVATTIGTGFSLQVTLARYGVGVVNWGRKNIEDQQYEKYDKTFAYVRVGVHPKNNTAYSNRTEKRRTNANALQN
jgi:hypothetical protein